MTVISHFPCSILLPLDIENFEWNIRFTNWQLSTYRRILNVGIPINGRYIPNENEFQNPISVHVDIFGIYNLIMLLFLVHKLWLEIHLRKIVDCCGGEKYTKSSNTQKLCNKLWKGVHNALFFHIASNKWPQINTIIWIC